MSVSPDAGLPVLLSKTYPRLLTSPEHRGRVPKRFMVHLNIEAVSRKVHLKMNRRKGTSPSSNFGL
jgi:hypothetical protein